jgi:hypothetical protein
MNQECSPLTSADMFHTDRGPPAQGHHFPSWHMDHPIPRQWHSLPKCPFRSERRPCVCSPHLRILSVSLRFSLSLIITLCVCLLTKTCPVKLGSQRKKDRSAFKFADDWKTDIWRNGQEWNIIHKISLRNFHNVS